MKKNIQFLVQSALIAAIYAGLTYLCSFFGLAYGPVQFRISEALTILPVLTPAAIPGLTVGCLIANIGSLGTLPLDMVFGTAATLVAALLTYSFKGIKWKSMPLLSALPPVICNAVIIGAEITFFFDEAGASLIGFLISALAVGIGQFAVCYGLGIPFFLAVSKNRAITEMFCRY